MLGPPWCAIRPQSPLLLKHLFPPHPTPSEVLVESAPTQLHTGADTLPRRSTPLWYIESATKPISAQVVPCPHHATHHGLALADTLVQGDDLLGDAEEAWLNGRVIVHINDSGCLPILPPQFIADALCGILTPKRVPH